jgi:hypothetical protein
MALNDYINDYPGWQNAAKANAQATRELAAAQREADSTPTTNKAAFQAAITKLNKAKEKRDTTKAKVDGIVSTATREFNATSNASDLAKTQKDFNTYDAEIKRLEALGRTPSALLKQQREDADARLKATPGYKAPDTPLQGEQEQPPKKTKKTDTFTYTPLSSVETGGNAQGPASPKSSITLEKERDAMRLAVNNTNSLESKANVFADQGSGAFANWASGQISTWQKTKPEDSRFNNRWEEIQTLLRETKKSKGTGPLGLVDDSDLTGLSKAFREAKSSGVYLGVFLNQDYSFKVSKGLTAGSGGGVTKTITTALKLLDAGDASDKLSTAYYKAYGRYPTQKQITNFKDQWNAEAKVQQAQGTSYRSKGFNKDVTVGEGFTDSEQSAFLNRYLIKNLKVDAANLGGDTKKIYDEIRSVYRDNFLPEPEFAQVAGVVKDLIGTADANVYNTKIAKVKETVGKQAAAFYPSISEALLNGDSVETYASVYRNTLAKKWGVTAESLKYDNEAQDLVKSAVNFKTADNKVRLMDNNEFNGLVQSTKRWKAGEEAFTSYSNIGDKLIAAFNLQGGVR